MNDSTAQAAIRQYPCDAQFQLLGSGAFAQVYDIGNGLAAKVKKYPDDKFIKPNNSALPELKHEETILSHLYEMGVSVPKPEGIFSFPMTKLPPAVQDDREEFYGLVMQKINGQSVQKAMPHNWFFNTRTRSGSIIRNLPWTRDIEASWNQEIKKAEVVCQIADAHYGNALFTFPDRKVYLIDVDFWKIIEKQ